MLLDKDIRKVVRRNQSNSLDDITKPAMYYGRVIPAASLSAGIYAAGLIFNDRSVSLTGGCWLNLFFTQVLLIFYLKCCFREAGHIITRGIRILGITALTTLIIHYLPGIQLLLSLFQLYWLKEFKTYMRQ